MISSVFINNNIRHSIAPFQRKETTNTPSFNGLTGSMKKHIYENADTMRGIYDVNKGSVAGKPPSDIVRALVNSSNSKAEARQNIADFVESINKAVLELKRCDELSLNAIDDFDFQVQAGKNIMNLNVADILTKISSSISKDTAVIEAQAARPIERVLKNSGVLTEDGKVMMKFLGSGEFGNAFKLSIIDENDKKIFHDKVIKVYRSKETQDNFMKRIIECQIKYFQNTSFDECWDAILKEIKAHQMKILPIMKDIDIELIVSVVESQKPVIEEQFNKIRNSNVDELAEQWNQINALKEDIHGCFAEANRALFIKDKIGNLRESNYVEPHYFDFKNGYAVMEMADNELPEVKKQIDLCEKFNLIHADAINPNNEVSGRIIDYGGIIHNSNLISSTLML